MAHAVIRAEAAEIECFCGGARAFDWLAGFSRPRYPHDLNLLAPDQQPEGLK